MGKYSRHSGLARFCAKSIVQFDCRPDLELEVLSAHSSFHDDSYLLAFLAHVDNRSLQKMPLHLGVLARQQYNALALGESPGSRSGLAVI